MAITAPHGRTSECRASAAGTVAWSLRRSCMRLPWRTLFMLLNDMICMSQDSLPASQQSEEITLEERYRSERCFLLLFLKGRSIRLLNLILVRLGRRPTERPVYCSGKEVDALP